MDRRRTRRHRETGDSPKGTSTLRTVEICVDKVVAEGDGLGRDAQGKVVFVQGALPGERVVADVVAESKDYARSVVRSVLDANPRRVDPACPYVKRGCGGCDLLHADDVLQMEIKAGIARESLVRLGGLARPEIRLRPSSTDSTRLRTSVRVAAAERGVGFRRRRSHDVVVIDECRAAHPFVNHILSGLVLAPGSEALIRVGAATGEGLVWSEPEENLVECPESVACGPGASIREVISGVEFRVSGTSFFQSSPAAAEQLVAAVAQALGPEYQWSPGAVVDAYGGVGLFTGTIVPADRRSILIEANPSSCEDARFNLRGHAVDVITGRVEDWTAEPVAIVIADPARDGLGSRAVDVLTAGRPEVFVLVSCDPASLGRDTKLLSRAGYSLDYCEVLDAFPGTHHVETVSRFVRVAGSESE